MSHFDLLCIIKYKPCYMNNYAENCMCISRCHIIFGGQYHNKFGNKVMKRHSSIWHLEQTLRTITWEDMFYLVLVATLWRTTSKYESNMYQYEECWFAAVSCMWIRNDMLCRWWIINVIVNTVISMVDRQLVITVFLFRRKTLVKVKLWTAGMWFLVRCQTDEHCTSTSFLFQMKHFHQDSFIARGADYCCFSYRSWNVFIIRPSSFYSTTWSMKRWWVVFISPDELFYVSTSV